MTPVFGVITEPVTPWALIVVAAVRQASEMKTAWGIRPGEASSALLATLTAAFGLVGAAERSQNSSRLLTIQCPQK
ncbi:hypothetical protein ACIPSA_35640 [Streptomyces sp. NPDC086549]|uniref:hypothetical protein n=1 Tax=Streptomyces sp. NPDC086549 TaxID=3365752 RepID=UPI0037FDC664